MFSRLVNNPNCNYLFFEDEVKVEDELEVFKPAAGGRLQVEDYLQDCQTLHLKRLQAQHLFLPMVLPGQ